MHGPAERHWFVDTTPLPPIFFMDTISRTYSTPSSRILRDHVSSAAQKRVLAVDPNGGRCLIENCSTEHGVKHCHIIPRYLGKDEKSVCDLISNPAKFSSHSQSG